MSETNTKFASAAHFVFRWAYLALAVAIFLLVLGILLSIPKNDSQLYLPVENSVGQWMLILFLLLLAIGLLLWGTGVFVYLLFKRHVSIRNLVGVVLLMLSVLTPHFMGGRGYQERVTAQLLAINEAEYLRFAQTIRKEMENRKEDFISYDANYSGHSGLPVRPVYEGILNESPLTIWPRQYLGVRMEKDSIILSRGTGMLGQIGVVIFDKGPLRDPQGPDHPRANSYFPVEFSLYPSVFFFTSD
ncbi:MAG: hypothetical protein H7Y06_07010 [Opitutaceae bacterium]|nr:hypothetical protein [Opitutaceae bacterium]